MAAIRAEILKLKRSLNWAVVIGLPLAMVASAIANSLASGEPLEAGWHTLWMRSVVFYGLFPLAIGIAILASLVWRAEHRGSNWNALMSGPTPSLYIVIAKATVVAGLAAVMQAVMLAAVFAIGKLVFGLEGPLPGEYIIATVLIMIATIPVAVLQSALSMFLRSFAAPIAVGLVAAGISVAVLMTGSTIATVSPYALASRATQLGTGTFADTGAITGGDIASILITTALLTVVLIAATTAILERRDTRI